MKKILTLITLSTALSAAVAQTALPPAWAKNTQPVQFSARTEAYISPSRIVWSNIPEGATASGLDNLLRGGIGQATLSGSKVTQIKNSADGEVSFILDFGRELQGGIQVVTDRLKSKEPAQLRIRLGESVSETMCEINSESGATNNHAMRDYVMDIPWLGVAEVGNSGFRFARIDVLGADTDIKIKEIRAAFQYRDIPYRGSFTCDNERLNDIWMTGAYTVHLNMQEYLWDGVKRDRLVWIGDLHPEVMTVNSVFGYNDVIPKSLDLIRDTTPSTKWMNNISSYSIWWLLIHQEWYKYQGDLSYLQQQREYIKTLAERLMSLIDENGCEKLDGKRFLDWPSSRNKVGIQAGLQSLMVMAMDAGEDLLSTLGEKETSKACAAAAKKLRSYTPDHNNLKQGAALMALAGLMDAERANDEVLAVGGAEGFSTFYGYYMLQAMAKSGNYTGAMDIISQYWGSMLDLGATTFWEDFDMKWMENAARIDEIVPDGKVDVHKTYGNYCYKRFRHSFCHGWASGPTSWLTEHVLGVKVLEAGCKKILIEPHLGDLKWVKGSFPTPMGDVVISHTKGANGKVKSTVDAPDGVKVIIK